jgi:hypothetical protein
MTNKIRVFDTHSTIHPDDGIDNLINFLQAAKHSENSGEWSELSVEWNSHDDYQTANWYIKGYRWETDKEYNKRIQEEEKAAKFKKKMKEDREERDKKEYERLKKKFGDK